MANLSQEEAINLIKSPKNGEYITAAIRQERRLQMHTNTVTDKRNLNSAYKEWLIWVQSFLPQDKWDKFEKLVTVPLATNKHVENIYTELGKVFDSQNSQRKAKFVDKSLVADYDIYDNELGLSTFMKTVGWDTIKMNLNSLVIIDLPEIQQTDRPEPYPYILNISRVHDVVYSEDGKKVEYVIFNLKGDRMCVIDAGFYRLYEKDALTNLHQLSKEIPHDLGYVPACSLYGNGIKLQEFVEKDGPLTNVLGDLDWYLFKHVSHRYLGLYGDYPIIITYKESCDNKNEQGNVCEGGRIQFDYHEGEVIKSRYDACPKCAGRKAVGAGSFWTVDAPRDKDDVDLMLNPMKIIEVSNDKLEFGLKQLKSLEDEFISNCIGFDGEPMNEQAKNEKQVQSNFESRQAVLERLKGFLEDTETFIWDTVLTIRYGSYYQGSIINYGNKFYLQTVEDLEGRYGMAKKAGKPMHELSKIRAIANKTENRNNPDEYTRVELLSKLEPWVDLSIENIQQLGLAETDKLSYFVKINFNEYIDRFEAENMDIVEFGIMTNISSKLKAIKSKLNEYAREQIAVAQSFAPSDEGVKGKTDSGSGNRNSKR